MLKRPSLVAMLLLSFTLLAPSGQAAPVYGAPIDWPPGPIQTADRSPTRSVAERWIIRLTDPPIGQAPGISPGFTALSLGGPAGGKLQLDSPAAQQYRAYLEQQQTSMFAQIQRALPAASSSAATRSSSTVCLWHSPAPTPPRSIDCGRCPVWPRSTPNNTTS